MFGGSISRFSMYGTYGINDMKFDDNYIEDVIFNENELICLLDNKIKEILNT